MVSFAISVGGGVVGVVILLYLSWVSSLHFYTFVSIRHGMTFSAQIAHSRSALSVYQFCVSLCVCRTFVLDFRNSKTFKLRSVENVVGGK